MKVTRTSPLTGERITWDIDITPEQMKRWEEGAPIQKVAPHLSADQREFIISGCTPEAFNFLFPGDQDEES